MNDRKKPCLKIVIKPETPGAKGIPLFAYWRHDGKLRGSMDGEIEQIAIKLRNGVVHRIQLKEGTRYADHYINAYEDDAPAERKPSFDDAQAARGPAEGDDIPF
jgi:hypothetical protein